MIIMMAFKPGNQGTDHFYNLMNACFCFKKLCSYMELFLIYKKFYILIIKEEIVIPSIFLHTGK
jgi:hypothetical protein